MQPSEAGAAPVAEAHAEAGIQEPALLAESATPSVNTAVNWLYALRDKDREALQGRSRYPFVYGDTGAQFGCAKGRFVAASAAALAVTLQCLLDNELLHNALKANKALTGTQLTPKELPRWTRAFRTPLAHGQKAVSVEVADNGVTFNWVLFVDEAGVHTAFRDTEFWPN